MLFMQKATNSCCEFFFVISKTVVFFVFNISTEITFKCLVVRHFRSEEGFPLTWLQGNQTTLRYVYV